MNKPLNPVSVYQETRPADWMPMPEPADDEIYLLVSVEGFAPIGLPFIVSCEGDYLVEIGTVKDGEFYPSASKQFQSGTDSDVLPTLQNHSVGQAILKISGKHLYELEFLRHDDRDHCRIVEIRGRLPECRELSCNSLRYLKYFMLEGKNKIEDMTCMFFDCRALETIPKLDTSGVTNMSYMFYGCHALETIPRLNTRNVKNVIAMFHSCWNLKAIPKLDTRNIVDLPYLFHECLRVEEFPEMKRILEMENSYENHGTVG